MIVNGILDRSSATMNAAKLARDLPLREVVESDKYFVCLFLSKHLKLELEIKIQN